MGPERRSLIISDKDKRVTAYHEAGHALVGKMTEGSDPVHKVTIIPRGRALGLTQQLPLEDRLNLSKEMAVDQIAVAMGGRIAEELIPGRDDGRVERHHGGNRMARKMVCDWGMSDKLGPLHFGKREEMVFLGRDFNEQKDYSEQTAIEIDGEVRRIVTENYDRAKKMITDNLDKLKVMAEALLEYETLDGDDIDAIFRDGKLEKPSALASMVPWRPSLTPQKAAPNRLGLRSSNLS